MSWLDKYRHFSAPKIYKITGALFCAMIQKRLSTQHCYDKHRCKQNADIIHTWCYSHYYKKSTRHQDECDIDKLEEKRWKIDGLKKNVCVPLVKGLLRCLCSRAKNTMDYNVLIVLKALGIVWKLPAQSQQVVLRVRAFHVVCTLIPGSHREWFGDIELCHLNFCSKQAGAAQLPPTWSALQKLVQGASYQAAIWYHA